MTNEAKYDNLQAHDSRCWHGSKHPKSQNIWSSLHWWFHKHEKLKSKDEPCLLSILEASVWTWFRMMTRSYCWEPSGLQMTFVKSQLHTLFRISLTNCSECSLDCRTHLFKMIIKWQKKEVNCNSKLEQNLMSSKKAVRLNEKRSIIRQIS